MNRNLYLRKLRNLRDQVDMLLMESGPQRLLEISEYDINFNTGIFSMDFVGAFNDNIEKAFKDGDMTAFNKVQEYIDKVLGERSKIEQDVDMFCEKVKNSSSVSSQLKEKLTPVLFKQLIMMEKNLDKLIADKNGKASGEALTIFYTTGLGLIIVSVLMAMLIKPDLKGDLNEIKDAFKNKEWLKLLKIVAKDLFRYGVIALPAIAGLVYILMAVLEQFTRYKVISALALFIKSSMIAPLLGMVKALAHKE